MRILSPAKINLHLRIGPPAPDGFHPLLSWMCTLGLHDTIEMSAAGKTLTLAEASAMKLYSAQAATEVAMDAVQLFGGNGYMAEFRVEQLARDAKVFQIYAGTDEIQVTHIARDLLSR